MSNAKMTDPEKYLEYIDYVTNYKVWNVKLRLSEERVAIALGISRDTLSKIRKWLVPSQRTKEKMANSYDEFISQFIK